MLSIVVFKCISGRVVQVCDSSMWLGSLHRFVFGAVLVETKLQDRLGQTTVIPSGPH